MARKNRCATKGERTYKANQRLKGAGPRTIKMVERARAEGISLQGLASELGVRFVP